MPDQIDLAKLAGVSAGTVSNVISASKKVSEASRKKVMEAVRALNYQPNLIARSLRTRKPNTLGIVVPDITIPFFPKVIRGAASACRERGYFLVVLDSQSSHNLELDMIALLRRRADGILLVTAGDYKWSEESVAQINSGPPIVCVDRRPESLDADSVCVDDRSAAELGVSHLLSIRGFRESRREPRETQVSTRRQQIPDTGTTRTQSYQCRCHSYLKVIIKYPRLCPSQ
jgi:DNA-binding LacI/PurR family transcriptional regulator